MRTQRDPSFAHTLDMLRQIVKQELAKHIASGKLTPDETAQAERLLAQVEARIDLDRSGPNVAGSIRGTVESPTPAASTRAKGDAQ